MKVVTKSFLRYLVRRRSLSVLQLLGIACGVAAVVGMTLSAQSALHSFREAIDFLRGNATHLIERPAGPLEEKTLVQIMEDPAVEFFSPVIDRKVRLKDGDLVRFLGIDPFLDQHIRPELARMRSGGSGSGNTQSLISFIVEKNTVIIDKTLADRMGIKEGGTLQTVRGDFHVVGTVSNPTGEPMVLMDIGHAQELFGLTGFIDRIDLIVRDDSAFRSRWEKGFRVESNKQRRETFTALLGAFQLNLQALSLLALFVGVFLIYNTSMFAVVSRSKDAGILRSLGARRGEIVGAFLSEILILGALGGALGGVLGYLLSELLTGLVGGTISSLYFFLRPEPLPWSWINVAAGSLLGCAASILGSVSPLAELTRIEPVLTLRGRVAYRGGWRSVGRVALAGLGVGLIGVTLLALSFKHVYVGFAGAFVFLLGVSLFTGVFVIVLSGPLLRCFAVIGGLPGRIAAGNIRLNLGRTSVAVAAFMVALSMSIGLGSMIGSFRESLVWWMNSQLRGEMYISTKGEADVPEDFYEEINKLPGIGGIDTYRNVQISYRGQPVYITAIKAGVLQKYARFGWVQGGNENWDPVKEGAIIVSESFARRFNLKRGDTVSIDSLQGATSLEIAAIFYDYTTEHGLIMMERDTYIRLFNDRTINSLGIFLDPGAINGKAVLEEVKKRAEMRNLPVAMRAQLHGNILGVFDSTFAVTRSMRILAIVVAFFGIAGALMIIFVERRKEFGIYRALGFSTHQIAAMTVLEGLGMGIISYIMSIGVGTALAYILIKVINLRSFNWTIFYHFSAEPYLLAAVTAILASVGASLYPLWKVYRTYPQMQIREE